jgi:thiamine biosynthesis lipoprotein ApbE
MDVTLSVAAWGRDTAALARALAIVRDTVQNMDAELRAGGGRRMQLLDSTSRELRARTAVRVPVESLAPGFALDRALIPLAGVADSALFDLGGQFLWLSDSARPTSRAVGIPDPDNTLRLLALVTLRQGSLRTVAQRNAPEGAVRSVTVLAADALTAGKWANVFFKLGCDSALARAPREEQLPVSVLCADARGVRWTPDLAQRVSLPSGPAPDPAPAPAGRGP